MHDSLLNLPNNPAYKHYFNVNEYERITAYDADLHRRARRNSWKKNEEQNVNKILKFRNYHDTID